MGNYIGSHLTIIFGGFFDPLLYGYPSDPNFSAVGVILLGNSGAGKSFLANVLIGEDTFKHECSPTSVTHVTDFKHFRDRGRPYVACNIPGLIENNQEAVERNKAEIQRAFDLYPSSIVVPVFKGGVGGRLQDDDIVTFNALNDAYKFEPQSVMFIMNDLPSPRPPRYEGETMVRLEQLLKMQNIRICFANRIPRDSWYQKRQLRHEILQKLAHCTPANNRKHGEIVLLVNKVKELEAEVKKRQDAFDAKLAELQDIIEYQQKLFEKGQDSDTCVIL